MPLAVNQITELGEHIMYFTGRTLDEALKAALDWAKVRKVTIGRYYQQPSFGGSRTVSILADYTVTK